MSSSCYSCGLPLPAEKAKGNFCEYCVDADDVHVDTVKGIKAF